MTFISYAQNNEDVVLWRALKQIENGFYVDVGANDPTFESVTQAFYERGWHGINIEPMQSCYQQLCSARPRDINLPVLAASVDGEFTFFEIPETGLSTTDAKIAQTHQESGYKTSELKINAFTLNHIFAEHVKETIHFLKIDVEGSEKDVLLGLDLTRWRPWILVIEATTPLSNQVNYDSWEPIVLSAGYKMVYFDGLNRFYVADEHSDLAESLKIPPNILDNFMSFRVHTIHIEYDRMHKELMTTLTRRDQVIVQYDQVIAEREQIYANLNQLTAECERLHLELRNVYNSRSYKITAPLRVLSDFARLLKSKTQKEN